MNLKKYFLHPLTITALVIILGIGGLWALIALIPESTPTENAPYVERSKGNASSDIVVTVYSDLQCPVCSEFSKETEALLDANYSDKIKFVYKHYPISQLHPNAQIAAEAAEAAGDQGKFFEYIEILFDNQNEATGWNINKLEEYAAQLGLDTARFRADVLSGKYEKLISDSKEEGTKLGVTGTPTVFLNGIKLNDWGYATISAEIEKLLILKQNPIPTTEINPT